MPCFGCLPLATCYLLLTADLLPCCLLLADARGARLQEGRHWARAPTAPEFRAMTYLAVLHGARVRASLPSDPPAS